MNLLKGAILVGQRGVEHGRVIRVDGDRQTPIEKDPDRVGSDTRHDSGSDIADRTALDRDPGRRQVFHQRLVLDCPSSVADALDLERAQGAPDALRTCRLAGVSGCVKTDIAGAIVDIGEGLGRKQLLRAAETDADDAEVPDVDELFEKNPAAVRAAITTQIGDEGDLDARNPIEPGPQSRVQLLWADTRTVKIEGRI